MQQSQNQNSEVMDSEADFTLTKIYSIREFAQEIWNLGLITYGGPMAHISILRKKFVQQMKCVTDQQFTQLMTICQSIPGPTSTQLLICIAMYATASFWGGLAAFVIFSLPTFIIMYICGISISLLLDIQKISLILPGLRIVAIAIILQAFYRLFIKIVNHRIMIAVLILTACAYMYYRSSEVILLLFFISGLVGFFFSKICNPENLTPISNRFTSCCYGLKNLTIFLITLVIVLIFLPEATNIPFIIFGVFYKIGALVIGGGHVILPLMYTSFAPYSLIEQSDFANGFSIISVLPGPMFNLSVYIGAFIQKSLLGSLAAFAGLYIPCFLFIMTIIPYWEEYRSQIKLKRIINGICCSSIGLILSAALILWVQQSKVNDGEYVWSFLCTIIVIVSFILLEKEFAVPVVFIIGGIMYVLFRFVLM